MNKIAWALFLLFLGAAGSSPALGVEDVGTSSAVFLKLGSGARSEALGEAYVGLADDADGLAYNPAGMAQSLSGELSASHALWFQGLTYDDFNAMVPTGNGGMVGGSLAYLSSPQIARTLLVGNGDNPNPSQNYLEDGSFSPYDLLASAAYARPLFQGLLGGAGLKLIDQSIDTESSFGLGLDFGLFWQSPFLRGLTAGLSVQNLGTPMKFESEAFDLPMIARAGAAYRFFDDALLVTVEGDLPDDNNPVVALGAEYNIADRFFPRVGWRYDDEFNPLTMGFGLRYDAWGLDLSAVPYGVLGVTYRASVDWRFGQPAAALAARLSYVSALDGGKPAELDAGMSAPDKVDAWAVYIYDSGKPARIVRVLTGFGPLKHPVEWDGRDKDGRPLAEGDYWAVLTVRYVTDQTAASPYVRLVVDNSAPVVALSLDADSLNDEAEGEAFVPTGFRSRVSSAGTLAAWRLEILDSQGRVFRTLSGAGAPPPLMVWDGKGDGGDELISARVYGARLWVKDAVGKEGMSPAPLSFKAVFR